MTGGELAIVIAGTRGDWPGGPRTLTPREPTREPNGTLWFGAELDPDGDQVWFRIAEDAVGRMPAETPVDRGRRLVARTAAGVKDGHHPRPAPDAAELEAPGADRRAASPRPPSARTPAGPTPGRSAASTPGSTAGRSRTPPWPRTSASSTTS